ncbi:MAG: malto-oligosyltrehalose synthase [Acidobacteriaceae bacterium]|nr:malto-oligosyltrehalose synthase [Acidobacteriaceae bacterium]MBV9778767.1 malto-oligosyltrehalose synthase [Acidobacteriaceae bacterium]
MPRIPVATYRLQLHADFGFDEAAAIADYLQQLGISHVYTSPYLQAAPGSQHGYDVVDHHKVNEELGGSEAHERFSKRLGTCGLGQVLDVVPNHMAISGRRNRYWWDVLENGPASRYAGYFDIDWRSQEEKLRNKLLVPILGDHYGRVLSKGEIQIKRQGGEFYLKYFEHELPVAPKSLPSIIGSAAFQISSDYLGFLSDSLARLPDAGLKNRSSVAERHRDKEVIRGLMERLFAEMPSIAEAVDSVIAKFNADVNALDDFLERQNYRLAYWRTAEQELSYRRFFDVNTLVGLQMENPQVFADTHALILGWLRESVLDGIRVDHPDGLRDPREYFEHLREAAPEVWIVAEKILEPGELLPSWPIDGTTGYDYLNQSGGLFVDPENARAFTDLYANFTGESTDYAAICRDKKHLVMRELLGSDVNRLTSLFSEICECHRDRRDYTRHDIIRAIREVVAGFLVYRTYVVPDRNEMSPEDERYIGQAIEAAKANRPQVDPELLDFLADVLTLRVRGAMESEFVRRFQQFTGAAMAKGVEDTAFYCFNRLISLNEVGGDPGCFGCPVESFHNFCLEVQKTRPRTMLASSTHDTKRSEDVRARINVLSEIPELWKAAVEKWAASNEKFKTDDWPDRNTEYLLYQTLIGAWPISCDRLNPYVEKACREAKQHTSWHAPNEAFEKATREFVRALYEDPTFLGELKAFVQPLIQPGRVNSLSQVLLKLTSPGIPDTYQGSELWDLSLVDPDNRRPVDYELRRRILGELPNLAVEEVWKRIDEGLPKLWTIYHTLRIRRQYVSAFQDGAPYRPLPAEGAKAQHAVAYMRGDDIAVLVPRLVLKLDRCWGDTSIEMPCGNWRNQLSGAVHKGCQLAVSEVLDPFPVALLTSE